MTTEHEHIDSVKTYVYVILALIALTVITAAVAFIDLGPLNVVVAITIASIKMVLVAAIFMHMRYSTGLTRVVVIGALMWLGILISFTMSDFVTRSWILGS